MKKFKQIKELATIAFLSIPFLSLADITLKNPIPNHNSFQSVLASILTNVLTPIAIVLITIMFVYYGLQLIMSQGNEAKVTKAKSMLLWALIGGFVILGASAITEVLTATTAGLRAN